MDRAKVFKFEFTSDPAQMILSLKRSGISFLMILLAPPPVILCLKLQYLKMIKKIHKYQSSILGLSRNSSFWNRVMELIIYTNIDYPLCHHLCQSKWKKVMGFSKSAFLYIRSFLQKIVPTFGWKLKLVLHSNSIHFAACFFFAEVPNLL